MLGTVDDNSISELPLVDGFTLSLSTRMLPTTYRALATAQWEVLRRASNYQIKMYSAPDNANATIPAYSQNEYLVRMRPGTYIWGMWMSATLVDGSEPSLEDVYFEITDMNTGEQVISDYAIAQMISAVLSPTERLFNRYPCLLGEPRLVGQGGIITIETYNSSSTPLTVQLVLFCAEPIPTADPCTDPSVPCITN